MTLIAEDQEKLYKMRESLIEKLEVRIKVNGNIKREDLTRAVATKIMDDWKSICPEIAVMSPFTTMMNLSKNMMEKEGLRHNPNDIITLARRWWPPISGNDELEKLTPEDEALEYAWHKVESMTYAMRKLVSGRVKESARRESVAHSRPDI